MGYVTLDHFSCLLNKVGGRYLSIIEILRTNTFKSSVKSGIVVIGSKVRHSFHKILNGRRGIIFELSTFNQKQSPL